MNQDGMGMEDAREGYTPDELQEMKEIEATGKLSAERMDFLNSVQPLTHDFVMTGDTARLAALRGVRSEVIKGTISVEKAKEDIEKLKA